MKQKIAVLAVALLFTAGALWAARFAWRVHRQIVTLNVREVPLAEVLRKIERQTRTRLYAEKALAESRITLRVTDQPLSSVLNRIAEQAGAHWSTLYAVYHSSVRLRSLETALRTDGQLEPTGWTKVAPHVPPDDGPPMSPGPNGVAPMPGARFTRIMKRGSEGPVMYTGTPDGKVHMWSPRELLAESSIAAQIGTNHTQAATAQAAAQTARKLNAKWTTYLAFTKSEMGLGFNLPPVDGPGRQRPALGPSHERFANLTPGQRVQLARQRAKAVARPAMVQP